MSEEYFDAYVPSQMAERAKASGIRKAKRDFLSALFSPFKPAHSSPLAPPFTPWSPMIALRAQA